jgi:hypothetical protein
MDLNGYEIFITAQTLPKIASPWTRVDLPTGSFYFKRTSDESKPFTISGYISKDTLENTKAEAEGLNDSLATNPSGTLIDGFGTSYTVLVDDWEISPIAAQNKYTFSMTLRIVN